jgi:succinate dehydrogenase hydrophobic anchor subunit
MNGSTDKEFVAWLLNRLAGLLLIFLLALHFAYMHFFAAWPIRFEDVVNSPFLRTVDLSLLAVVVYHTFYGFRAWLLDFNISDRARTSITVLVGLAGLAAFIVGVRIFFEFLV